VVPERRRARRHLGDQRTGCGDLGRQPGVLARVDGVEAAAEDDFVFAERLGDLNEMLESLNSESQILQAKISAVVSEILGNS
jgi:hypothetical protein